MRSRLGRVLVLALAGALAASCSGAPARPRAKVPAPPAAPAPALAVARPPEPGRLTLPASALSEDQRILHVLNRLAYGPRPGDLERVRSLGLATYLERQLAPAGIPDERAAAAVAVYPTLAMGVPELLQAFPDPTQQLARARAEGMSPESGRPAAPPPVPPERRPARIAQELQAAKLTRAVLSERQLEEVLADFWFNHFNVDARKGAVRWMIADYERTAIRPHVLGRFRELLLATARHPAMLFYLDNWLSTAPGVVARAGPERGRPLGLNENYARELMELHTLGVDGGYTQQDVIAVARAFTGWSIDRPRERGVFVFRAGAHDRGEKTVLGHTLPAGGDEAEGVRVIELLARHPSTARFIATKLCRRFVSDEPPPALVERLARVFRDTDGDLRQVMAALVTAPEFHAPEAYRAKIKAPLELVASAVRALDGELAGPAAANGAEPRGGFALAGQVGKLGAPLYQQQPPTGYPDVAEAWVNTGALLGRMNFALALTANRVPGVRVDLGQLLGSVDGQRPERVLEALLAGLLQGQATPETRSVLQAQLDSPVLVRAAAAPTRTDVEKLAALVLGSPEFQRR